jgi:phage shock protein A
MATASSIGFASLWVSAVQNYELSTGRVLANDDTFARIKTLEELQLTLQSQEDGFASFRAQNKGIADKLTTCFSPLVPLLDLAGKAIGATPYAPVAVAFGAVAHLFKASTSVTKSYDSVEELFEEVGNITTRLQSYDGDATEESLRAKVTTILAYILEIVGTAEKLVKRGRFKQWARSVFVQDDEIGEGLTKLRRFVDGELGLVTALTYARVGETQGDVRAVAKALDEVKVSVESSNQALADAKQTALSRADEELLKASLAPQTHTAVLRKHSNNLTSLAPDTGNWLHDETSFQAWLADDFPVFWVLGKRGVGKTFLAARAYEVLKAAKQHLVSIAYFEEQTSALQNSEDILRSAAAQLGQQIEAFRSHAIEVFRKCEGAFDVRSFWSNVVLDFFCQPSSSTPSSDSAIIVIDGIDEASRQERSALFSCLAELVKVASATQTCKLKVIIFTRPDVFGDPGFHDHGIYRSVESSTVTSDKNSSDIASYIKQEIAKHEFLKNLKKTKKLSLCGRLARAIYHSISTRAQGMFQWASLVFDQIRDLRSAESIMKALEDSPAELDAMLHHTLKKLATEVPATQAYLHDLLLWVLDDGWNVTVADLFVLLRLTLKESFYMLESDLRWKFSSIFEIREIKYVNRESRQPPPESEESLSTSGASDDDFLDLPDDELVDFDDLSLSSTDMDFAQVKDGTLVTSMAIDGEIPAHWDDLEITFAHASIVEFLKIELGPQRRWHDLSLHREGRSNAEHRMFRALLELQQNYASGPICDTAFYYKFVYGWYHRFTALGLGEEFDTETILLAQSLANLFSNGEAVMKWAYIEPNRFVILSFSSDQIPCLIQQLLDKHSATLPPEQQQWVQEINVSVRALFRPMAEVCARAWLVHNSWNDEFYMKRQVDEQDAAMILCAYNRLVWNLFSTDCTSMLTLYSAKGQRHSLL